MLAIKDSIHSTPNRLMNLSIKSIRSWLFVFPCLGIMKNINGNATPSQTMPNIYMLIAKVPNFQLVLSIVKDTLPLLGINLNINKAIRSKVKSYDLINVCIRLKVRYSFNWCIKSVSKLLKEYCLNLAECQYKAR